MLRNYLKITLRTLRRSFGHTAINVAGLAVAMATCLLIWLYVQEELSYDDFHPEVDQIHAVTINFGSSETRRTPDAMGALLNTKVPGIEEVVQVGGNGQEKLVRRKDRDAHVESEQRVLTADSTFFDVFSGFELKRGHPTSSFGAPNQIVISESLAETAFEDADPIGKTLIVGESKRHYTVTGVAEVPANSTIQFDVLVPDTEETLDQPWKLFGFHTYVKTAPKVELDNLTETVAAAAPSEIAEKVEEVSALPLPELYLSSHYSTNSFRGHVRSLYLFGTVALLILLIAGINYVNLVLAQATRRTHEVGVRKSVGAQRSQLAGQFLFEIGLLSVVSLAAAIGLVEAILPTFNALFNTSLTLTTARHRMALLTGSVFVLAITLLAGIYPAFVLSRFRPTRILRSCSDSSGGGKWLRKGLVITQFAASAGLILGTLIVYQQLGYLQDKSLGFDAEQVVSVDLDEVPEDRYVTIWNEVRRHPLIDEATISGGAPGGFFAQITKEPGALSPAASASTDDVRLHLANVDTNYIETLGINLLSGQSFAASSGEVPDRSFILNKAAVEDLGWSVEEAVGKSFTLDIGGDEGTVIGVVDNFHVESLHNPFAPVVLYREGPTFGAEATLMARLGPEDIRGAMNHIEEVINAAAPASLFSYTFLDNRFDRMYRSEERLARIFTAFALIAILIACMGLFGLSSLTVQRRTKEIGIRKALGATTTRIVGLLSKEYTVLVGIALLVGLPIAYVGTQRWLQNFAFQVEIGIGVFSLTALLTLGMAGVAVLYHALRAAHTDPAQTLRDE